MKINLVLLTRNSNFARNFTNYVNSEQRLNFGVAAYTDLDKFMTKSLENIDILIMDIDIYSDVKDMIESLKLITVLLHNGKIDGELQDRYNISMFNESNKIIEYLQDIYQEEKKIHIDVNSDKEHKFISFFSPIGGSGKTTLSLVYSQLLAEQGYKVLYLSLDHFMEMSHYFGVTNKEDLTFLFATLDDTTQIEKDINEMIIKVDGNNNLSYINGFSQYSDRLDISQEQWEIFCRKLVGLSEYDLIVLDLPTDLDKKARVLLDMSNYLLMVLGKTSIEQLKFKAFQKYMNKLHFFKNLEGEAAIYTLYNNSRNVKWDRDIEEMDYPSIDIDFDAEFKQFRNDKRTVLLRTDTTIGEQLRQLVGQMSRQIVVEEY